MIKIPKRVVIAKVYSALDEKPKLKWGVIIGDKIVHKSSTQAGSLRWIKKNIKKVKKMAGH